ncbi:hypothetical protein [Mycolicibacterium stellerae]|uniref:hypothetical protein n=1 Tax=Mycolicibacterium stellerae TaxID=2358193 RepID=UPI000F0B1236|nr:hypothetical protein [Mycolicibacterium stellerae]
MKRVIIELVAAIVAGAAAVWCWFGAQTVVTVAPILEGEPQTTSVAYSPPMLVLMLLLATVAGVLTVVGVTRLIAVGRAGSAAVTPATGPVATSGPF